MAMEPWPALRGGEGQQGCSSDREEALQASKRPLSNLHDTLGLYSWPRPGAFQTRARNHGAHGAVVTAHLANTQVAVGSPTIV